MFACFTASVEKAEKKKAGGDSVIPTMFFCELWFNYLVLVISFPTSVCGVYHCASLLRRQVKCMCGHIFILPTEVVYVGAGVCSGEYCLLGCWIEKWHVFLGEKKLQTVISVWQSLKNSPAGSAFWIHVVCD